MAKSKRTVFTCDHPKCDSVAIVEQRIDLPGWFHGTAVDIGDGLSINWYACCDYHIGGAVTHVFKEARDADH